MIVFLGTYPPRQCGIATFTADMYAAIGAEVEPDQKPYVIAVTNTPESYAYPPEVRLEIRQHRIADYRATADFVNNSPATALSVQHEYGIYGGPAGRYLLTLLRRVHVPIVTTMHTVLAQPDPEQKRVFDGLQKRSDMLVVMTERGRQMLLEQGVSKNKVVVIPHGVPDLPFVDPNFYKEKFNVAGKKVILTFGLIGPGKGLETMIDAMPIIVEKHPDVAYLIVGATHPELRRQHKEEYRIGLQRQVRRLNLDDHVIFHNRFVTAEELAEFLCSAEIYVTPYPNEAQITSGTLAYAVGSGKAVVSTPYWHAQELLADNRGILVPFHDSNAMAQAVIGLLDNQTQMHAMRKRAYEYGRDMVWREVARSYIGLFDRVCRIRQKRPVRQAGRVSTIISAKMLPDPHLDHIQAMTDGFGLLRHAVGPVPDYGHGYCVDDSARALVVATKALRLTQDEKALAFLQRFLAFVLFCQREDGQFRNFLTIDRRFTDEIGSDDCQGRALWGLGYVLAFGPRAMAAIAKGAFDRRVDSFQAKSLRGAAYSMLGLHYYLTAYPGAVQVRTLARKIAGILARTHQKTASQDWDWFEAALTYDNGVVAQAMWLAARHLEDEDFAEVAARTTDFLFSITTRDDHISLVGNDGWHSSDRPTKPHFDQQPVDACGLVELAKVAYRATGSERYLRWMRMAFDWFLGDNDLGVPMVDLATGRCYDGLTPNGPNENCGAESTLSYLLALLTLTEVSPEEEDRQAFGHATVPAKG
ncbi:MAG: glycosyltransferase family 4 protein [Phycisphaerae bacterium]|nr:glycosyltransferase family 4 protein [Phycisphaerae bacterium]